MMDVHTTELTNRRRIKADHSHPSTVDSLRRIELQAGSEKQSKRASRYKEQSSSDVPAIIHICADCTKPAQVQCLHCSEMTCIDCVQQHIRMAQVDEQVHRAQRALEEKTYTLDQIAANVTERIDKEFDKLVQLATLAREQCYRELSQAIESDKRCVREKSKTLAGMSVEQISSFVELVTAKTDHWSVQNAAAMFSVTSNTPKMRLRRSERRDVSDELNF